MFGSKSKEIARLARELNASKSQSMIWESHCKSEQANTEYWIKQFNELNDRYSLLDSVLRQLHINITLPAKKIARKN